MQWLKINLDFAVRYFENYRTIHPLQLSRKPIQHWPTAQSSFKNHLNQPWKIPTKTSVFNGTHKDVD